jgi:hypothetical protein
MEQAPKDMSVAQLRAELGRRELDTHGTKTVLAARLISARAVFAIPEGFDGVEADALS